MATHSKNEHVGHQQVVYGEVYRVEQSNRDVEGLELEIIYNTGKQYSLCVEPDVWSRNKTIIHGKSNDFMFLESRDYLMDICVKFKVNWTLFDGVLSFLLFLTSLRWHGA
ncbi:hypothetical protein ACJX0J_005615, partial [Zea mays]